jgi:hypothetical protein
MPTLIRHVIGIVFWTLLLLVIYALYPWVLAIIAVAVTIHNFGR